MLGSDCAFFSHFCLLKECCLGNQDFKFKLKSELVSSPPLSTNWGGDPRRLLYKEGTPCAQAASSSPLSPLQCGGLQH